MLHGAFDPTFLPFDETLEEIAPDQHDLPRAALISAALVGAAWAIVITLAFVL